MELFSAALGVAGGAAAAQAVAQLREHRTEPTGLADLLGWGFLVGDGVVLQKDGSLLAGFAYSGPDVSAATAAELDALTQHVNDALLPFADDWMLHIDAIRRPAVAYPPGVFPDAVSRLIDDERRAAYRLTERGQFETSYALVITHLPRPSCIRGSRPGLYKVATEPVSIGMECSRRLRPRSRGSSIASRPGSACVDSIAMHSSPICMSV